jgi:magnesium-transporting ATPase (P-type)
MNVTSWLPAVVAICTIIANAAVTFSAVSRHERVLEDLRDAVQDLRTEVAVLKATKGGDGS